MDNYGVFYVVSKVTKRYISMVNNGVDMTREQQINLVKYAVGGLTQQQAEAIADLCLTAKARGDNAAVWHQSAIYFGRKCNCMPCNPNRKTRPFRAHSL